jgi:hypothetical protein
MDAETVVIFQPSVVEWKHGQGAEVACVVGLTGWQVGHWIAFLVV